MHVWDDLLSSEEREAIRLGGYGQASAVGRRPCVMVVDMQTAFVGEDVPLLETVKKYPGSIGDQAWRMVPRQREILETARGIGIPVVHTRIVPTTRRQGEREINWDMLGQRIRRKDYHYEAQDEAMQIIDELVPQPEAGDIVVEKNYASAFYASPLLSYLIKLDVDTLIVTGLSTSGCVRATAVDASSMNFHVVVVEDCVVDRIQASHKSSLLDIWMKYGEVWRSDKVLEYLREVAGARKPPLAASPA